MSRPQKSWLKSVLIFMFSLIGSACGGSQSADLEAHPLPAGVSFTGVWFSPQYGRMDLVQTGNSVVGHYVKDEREGRIQGRATGDILRFRWTEKRELLQGRPQETSGRGYFRYVIESEEHKIVGEWGHGSDEVGGGPWDAVKSKRLRPQMPTTPEQRNEGDPFSDEPGNSGQGNEVDSSSDNDPGAQPQSGGSDRVEDVDGML